jgi:PAT family beta-lactamase induction signal transducer AmpG
MQQAAVQAREGVRRTTREALAAFLEPRALAMMALGFSSGLPFLLIFDTLSAWLREVGLSLEVIGFFSLATLVFSFKFLWAPLVDRTRVPVLTTWLGHRRSWMLVCQALVMLGLWLISLADPTTGLARMATLAVFVGFCAATQDIAIDAWRIEIADVSRQGIMASAYQWGYRAATLTAGAAPLFLASSFGWNVSYGVMAALMGIGIVATLAAPRENAHTVRDIHVTDVPRTPARDLAEWGVRLAILAIGALILGSGLAANASLMGNLLAGLGLGAAGETIVAAWRSPAGVWVQFLAVIAGFGVVIVAVSPVPGTRTLPGVYLASALGDPLRNFFERYGSAARVILALICLYRLSDFVLNIMNPFYLDLGFTLTEVAEVRKIFGVAMTLLGVFGGGLAIVRFGMLPSLLAGAFAGPVSNLVFVWLATQGHQLYALFIAIGVDNVMSGFAATVLIAYMSSLTAAGFTATQYALFSSLYAIPGRLVASQSGRIVESAAHSAETGGVWSMLHALFGGLPPGAYADAFEKSGVSPISLGAGYLVFFLYSSVIGVFAVVLAFIVVYRERARRASG